MSREPIQLDLIPAWFRPGFRSLSRAHQWLVGVPTAGGCLYASWLAIVQERAPGEPQQAFFFTLLLFVAVVVLSELLRPKPQFEDARPSGIGDFQFPTATEGRPVPLLFGRNPVKGANVVWYGDLRQEAITEKVKTGMFSSTRVTKGFRYRIGIQFALARGPDCELLGVKIGEKDAFSGTVVSGATFDIDDLNILGGEEFGTGGIQATCDFYGGETTQAVNAYLNDDSRQRIATAITPTAPRYTGTCHVVARQLTSAPPTATDKGAYVGNSTNIQPWEFEIQRFPVIFSGQSAGQNKIGTFDCNPINVIYELLTNVEWGFGFAASTIDVGVGSTFALASANMIAEVNGFAMLLDRTLSAQDFLNELQRQIDGVVFIDHRTGKWTIQLVRAANDANFGYDIDLVPQFTDEEIKELKEFTRGAWEDTTNQIQVKYAKRDDNYKESYALAQDMANAILLAAGSFLDPTSNPGIINYPGVKTSPLASNLAWRELRGQSFPLARAKFITNRKFFDLTIAGVFAWTNPRLGFTKLPMRVQRINYGTLQQNEMTVDATQDVFGFAAASMGSPGATGWVPPSGNLVAYPANEQLAFEAPRGFIVRDPTFSGDDSVAKVWCGARQSGDEVAFVIGQRNAAGVPAGSFADSGEVIQFLLIGQLNASLDAGTAIPTPSIIVDPTPDSQLELEGVFDDAATVQDLGVDLVHLIRVGTELMLVSAASLSGPDVDFTNVFRGVLGTAQQNHPISTDVFLLFVGGGMNENIFNNTFNVDIELRPRTASTVFAGVVTTIAIALERLALQAYPPQAVFYNGSGTRFNTPDLEGDGAGLNGVGFDVDWHRRRFDVADEVAALLADDPTVDASTEFRVTVFSDPLGANDQVFQSAFVTGTGPITPTQAQIINQAAAGTLLRVEIEVRHDIGVLVDLLSTAKLLHDVTPTSVRTAQFYLQGDLRAADISNTYVVASATVHNVTIGAAYGTSNVEISINGGGFVVIITAGGTTGATAVLAVNDTIRLRHTTNEAPDPNFVEIDDGTSDVAYGAFSA